MQHPLNVFFDKIFVITIKRNNERLEMFVKGNPDLEIEIFPGIDGTELFPSIKYVCNFPVNFFIENKLLYDRCQIWNKGQLGCAMSNLKIQKEIVDRKLQKVLVLEDDAFLVTNQIAYFNKAVKELPPDWDLFYLGFNAL